MGLYNKTDEQSSVVPRKREGRAVLAIQSGLARIATLRKHKRFYNLHPLLWKREWLNSALDAVLDNTGAKTSGVDGMCGFDLHEPSARARFIEELRTELKQRTYCPSPVLRKYIPKANGGERPIGIPTIRDRVVQMVLKMVLEPIFEADFLPNSNGFRPERSTLECVLPMYRYGDSNMSIRMGHRGRHRRVLRQHRPRDTDASCRKKDSRHQSPVADSSIPKGIRHRERHPSTRSRKEPRKVVSFRRC